MTFRIIQRGDSTAAILFDFRCPEHGVFEATVPRDDSDATPCPECGARSPWAPSPVRGKVKNISVAQGGWEKPEHKGWLDTRELGEGMEHDEWKAKRETIRDDLRRAEINQLIRER